MRTFQETGRDQGRVAGVPGLEAAAEKRGLGHGAGEIGQRERIDPGHRTPGGREAARNFHARRPGRHEEDEGTRTHRGIISGGPAGSGRPGTSFARGTLAFVERSPS